MKSMHHVIFRVEKNRRRRKSRRHGENRWLYALSHTLKEQRLNMADWVLNVTYAYSDRVVRCKSGLYSLNIATYNLIFLNKDEFIIIIARICLIFTHGYVHKIFTSDPISLKNSYERHQFQIKSTLHWTVRLKKKKIIIKK
jgi:hypothetical protein